ncbi:PREDICTED: uncharacterized protein LOC106320442 [Brassica oleracea var. oleracea]|uniref:uncharacterized protein LOC106320442 n=1 Tax=Brassica oleracea var. oleracea TaxID=109376 RepID=UPI0006A6EE4C|nr:PREDICTED: uncharacterized protein LOC106320442 [Brassica oleracea var. oleracea]
MKSDMRGMKLKKKSPAMSWVEVDREMHTFMAGDLSSHNSERILETLEELIKKAKDMGYFEDKSCVFQDVEESAKERSLHQHSEKLAIAFAVWRNVGGSIRILKNLRNLHSKIEERYNDLNNKFRVLENQFAAINTYQNRQQDSLPGKSEQNPKETMKAITLRSGKELPHRALTKDAEKQGEGVAINIDDEMCHHPEAVVPKKLEDPGCFTLPCVLRPMVFERLKYPVSILEDLPVMVGNYEIPTDFVVLEMRHILHFDIKDVMKKPTVQGQVFYIEEKDALVDELLEELSLEDPLQHALTIEREREILKFLNAGVIYPISDSKWVSPMHVVPKQGGITVIKNDKDELIPTRTVTGHRMCIDYRKLNSTSRKDHFPLPFIDQMLERLANHPFYCFLDGYSGFFQIPIHPNDQEKTTFTCPYGTFAYRRMPFGLCNAPATFQRCMMSIFSDLIEDVVEVFMDDFSVYGSSFSACLSNLCRVLQRCEDTNLVLNWEKCHFMVKEGIVMGHKISEKGIEVDKAKIDVMKKDGKTHVIYYASQTLNDAQMRTAYKTPLGTTPFNLVYGKACHLLVDLEYKALWAVKLLNFDIKRKLKSRWSGPFKVKEFRPYGAIVLWSTDGRDFTVNGQRVKFYMATAPEEDGVSTPLSDPTPA